MFYCCFLIVCSFFIGVLCFLTSGRITIHLGDCVPPTRNEGPAMTPWVESLPEASCQWRVASLSDNHLLHFYIIVVDQTQHVDACGLVEADFGVAVEGLAFEYASHDVNHLQRGLGS